MKEELTDPEEESTPIIEGGEEETVPEVREEPKKRSRTTRFFLGLLKFSVFSAVYLVVGVLAVGGGVGWHYLDANADYDLSRVEELATGARVVDAAGRPIGRIGATDRKLIEREDLPDSFVDALLAAEDQRFFFHPGFDPAGTVRAAIANYRAESIREGGSTLTQQLARDVYGLKGKHIERKLNEIALAFWIEREYSKDEILVHYLNRIYFGSGFYGLGAAAQGYFDKPVSELKVDESAMLCGLIRSPSRLSPFVSQERALNGRDQTLERMVAIERLTEEEKKALIAGDTVVANNRNQRIHRGQASFLLARIEKETRDLLGDRSLEGLTIQSSVDLELQQSVAYEIDKHLTALQEEQPEVEGIENLEGAAVVVENETGRVLLTVGSRDFLGSEYDRSRNMKRPPGSAFLPFVYAAALESGEYELDSIVIDAPFDNREMGLGGTSGVLGEWSTENPENTWDGPITLARALRERKNSPAARLGLDVGLDAVSNLVARAGVKTPIRDLSGSLLGASELTLSELVRAYTIFPNGGVPSPPISLIESITAGDQSFFSSSAEVEVKPVISDKTAEAIVVLIGGEQSGTTPAFTDGWHVGFNDEFTWGIWVGKDTFETIYPMAFGGKLAKPIAEAFQQFSPLKVEENKLPTIDELTRGQDTRPLMKRRPIVEPSTAALIGNDPYGTLGFK